jgi:alkanesulfonate monooxygenase SsuD/methylene tetrahydromethanopterin reductase-like flavin-dependent oxidoreductase (luciferase family)
MTDGDSGAASDPGIAASSGGLHFGVHLPIFAEPQTLVRVGVAAEEHGWDGCFLWDHILGSQDMAMPMVDPWVVLGALAVRTRRIRLGTAVTALARRRPHKLARETVTVDRLSGGRMVLGVGLGKPVVAEYGAFGEPTDQRVLAAMLDEGLEVLAGLWSGKEFSHAGRYFRVDRATFLPRPLQSPRIPVWTACSWPHRRPLARAARWDGVLVAHETPDGGLLPIPPDEVAGLVAEIRRRQPVAGFDVAVIGPGLPDLELAGAYAAAGATWYLATGWLEELGELVEAGPPA